MKIGFPQELLHFGWAVQLKEQIDDEIPGIAWVHAAAADTSRRHTLMLSEGDACFPYKKMIRAAIALLPQVDRLFVPRLVRLDGHLLCPNFRALPDIVALNRKRMAPEYQQTPIVDTVVDISSPGDAQAVFEAIVASLLSEEKNPSRREIPGNKIQGKEKATFYNEKKTGIPRNQKTIALIGRSYLVKDPKLNMGIPSLLEAYGYNVQTPQDVAFAELDKLAAREDYFAKTLYWRGARECLGAFIHFTEQCEPAGIIYQLAFNCGVDALVRIELMSLHKKLKKKIPFMVLVGDEHTQREHIVTRLEAFLDVIDGITAS
jgi:predicted nucleotide-binding protein (sugar kinase/HSP70/actin superfamily)